MNNVVSDGAILVSDSFRQASNPVALFISSFSRVVELTSTGISSSFGVGCEGVKGGDREWTSEGVVQTDKKIC